MKRLGGMEFLALMIISVLCVPTLRAQAAPHSTSAPALPAGEPPPSLAEMARRARAEKATKAAGKKATRVYDNDSFPTRSKLENSSSAKPAPPEESSKKTVAKNEPADSEREWRAKFAKLRTQLKLAEGQVELLKQEMAKASPTSVTRDHYYYDPKYIRELQAKVDSNNQQIARLKKQLADLEEEFRRKGLPSSWAN